MEHLLVFFSSTHHFCLEEWTIISLILNLCNYYGPLNVQPSSALTLEQKELKIHHIFDHSIQAVQTTKEELNENKNSSETVTLNLLARTELNNLRKASLKSI